MKPGRSDSTRSTRSTGTGTSRFKGKQRRGFEAAERSRAAKTTPKTTPVAKPGPARKKVVPKGETFKQAFAAGRAAAKKAGNAAGGTFSWKNKDGKTEKYKTWTAEEKAAANAGAGKPKKATGETGKSLWGRVKKAVGEPRPRVDKQTMKERQRQAQARRTASAFPEGPTAQRLQRDKRRGR